MSAPRPSLDELKIDRSAPARRPSRGWVVWVVLLLLLAAAAGVWFLRRPPAAVIRTAVAREAGVGNGSQTVLNASGYVVARREATVSSKVTGKVVEVLIEEGMRVSDGQVLARLDASNIETNLRLAEAQVKATAAALAENRVRLDEANKELRRVTRLKDEGIATQADLDRAEAEVRSLEARLVRQEGEVAVAERQQAVWQQQLDDTVIRAPFAGIAVSKNAQPGEMISPVSAGGGFTRTGIGTIVDMESLEIEVDVSESYINRVEPGQAVEATLDAYPDWKLPCRVIAIIPTADRQKATVKVRVGFNQLDPRILPQMGVKVAFRGSKDAPAVARTVVAPKSAVRRLDGKDVVWVVANGQVERRAITLGAAQAEEITVLAGLTAGEKVVVDAPPTLAAGDRVKESP